MIIYFMQQCIRKHPVFLNYILMTYALCCMIRVKVHLCIWLCCNYVTFVYIRKLLDKNCFYAGIYVVYNWHYRIGSNINSLQSISSDTFDKITEY